MISLFFFTFCFILVFCFQKTMMQKEIRRPRTCVLCRNHGFEILKAGHRNCPYEKCECEYCDNSRKKREGEKEEIQRKRQFEKDRNNEVLPQRFGKWRKEKQCRKCRNHKVLTAATFDHTKNCERRNCNCPLCTSTLSLRLTTQKEINYKRKRTSTITQEVKSPDSGYSTPVADFDPVSPVSQNVDSQEPESVRTTDNKLDSNPSETVTAYLKEEILLPDDYLIFLKGCPAFPDVSPSFS